MTERERRRLVIEHLRSGKAEEAALEMAASREPYPGDEALHHAIGLAFASRGTLGRASEQLEAAAQLDPKSAEILTDLAQVRLAQGNADGAVEPAERAAVLAPHLAIARFTLGRAYFVVECARQARRPPGPERESHFSLTDGRTPTYLRALEEMEAALDATPPFLGAVREALAVAYQRAGHYHAAAQQLRARAAELEGEQAEEARALLRDVEYEIAREQYWAVEAADLPAIAEAAEAPGATPEARLRLAHACHALGHEKALTAALAEARAAHYRGRDARVTTRRGGSRSYQEVSDAHVLTGGGLECIIEEELRFLPFVSLASVRFGEMRLWRTARLELREGEQLDAVVPALYRHSLRSPSELIRSGRFTQFSYAPGETRYAHAIGARNWTSTSGVIPFGEIECIAF